MSQNRSQLDEVANTIAPPPGATVERLTELDALRGLAAATVALGHFHCIWWPVWMVGIAYYSPLFLVVSATPAVTLFFILSGFVLSLPYIARVHQTYRAFIVKRVFRIYIPYLAALAFAVLGSAFFHGMKIPGNGWFNSQWTGPVELKLVLQHILFLGKYDMMRFDSPIWSVVEEMRISLIFPFLCVAVLRLPLAATLVSLPLFYVAAHFFRPLIWVIANPYIVDHIVMFILGILIAIWRKELSRWITSKSVAFCLLYVTTMLLIVRLCLRMTNGTLEDVVSSIGMAGILILSLRKGSFAAFLRSPIPQFLGHISYSVYLIHVPILLILVYTLHDLVPLPWILLPFLVLTLLLGSLCYRFVELPSMQLGRKLSRRFK